MNVVHSSTPLTGSWYPSREIQVKVRRVASEFQVRSDAALEALEVIRDPECSIRALVAIARRDPRLTTDILKFANSALFGSRARIASLDQAVMRLGLTSCKNIILACIAGSMLRTQTEQYKQFTNALWPHCLLTATTASNLNAELGIGLQGEEYAAGLIHDIGRLLQRLAEPQKAAEIDVLDFNEGPDLLALESKHLGTNHAVLGAWFTEDMRFPVSIVTSIRFHHRPEDASEALCLTALVAAADEITNYYHRKGSLIGYDLEMNKGITLLEEHGVFDAREKLKGSLGKVMEKAFRDAAENR
ncbi:MAG: HDOD domain-containing protein [Planctomycetota bacterium]